MYISLFFIFKHANSIECKGFNTVMAFNNECVCVDGFPYGDPNSDEGCYRCNENCHKLSKCEYPGKCVCTPPYHGDGIFDCSLDIPSLISFSPSNGTTNGGTNIQIHFAYSNNNKEKNPDVAYCRFGALVVRSESVSDTIITCQTPPHRAKPAFLSISFDTITWSKDDVFFNFVDELQEKKAEFQFNNYDEIESNRNKNVGFLSIVIICVILLSSLLIMILKRYQVANQLPFALRKKTVQD